MSDHRPIKERILKTQSSSLPVCTTDPHANRPSKYKQWNNLNMREAVNAVLGGASVTRAAEEHGIPKATLNDYINGRSQPGVRSGPPTLLTQEEEADLASFLLKCGSMGIPKTRKEVLTIVESILSAKGSKRTITNGWWARFTGRHKEVALRTPASISVARMQGASQQAIDAYFDELTDIFEEHGFVDTPSLVFNMDESGFPLSPPPPKAVYRRGTKNSSAVGGDDKTQVTVVACCSASGQVLPPMVIWDRKNLKPALTQGEVPATIYGLSSKGWMDGELFHKWFKRHFLRYAPATRPLILLMDGHSSHYNSKTLQLAAEHEIILFTLPPNTTHCTQPLDKGVFGPLKQKWREVCHDYMVSHPGKKVIRDTFSPLFSRAWISSMTAANCISGFKTTGILPLDPLAVKSKLPFMDEQRGVLYDSNDIQRFALFSPQKCVLNSSCEDLDDMPSPVPCLRKHTLANIENMATPHRIDVPLTPIVELNRALTSVECKQRNEELKEIKEKQSKCIPA